jgi:hypothetical protein
VRFVQTPRETRACVARLSVLRVTSRTRTNARCGSAALDFGDVRIAGALVEIPVCRKHFRMLRDSADPVALARDWTL